MTLAAGARLGPYEILSPLGAGGMGEVYRGRDKKLDRDVAIKVLPAEMAADPERLERFRREAKALAALDHPAIVGVYSVEEANGVHFLTMQLVEGRPLDDLIAEGFLPVERLLEMLSGATRWFIGRFDEALPDLQRGLELDPQSFVLRWCVGYTCAALGQISEAARHAAFLREIGPDVSYTRQLLALIDGLEGRKVAASERLTSIHVTPLDAHNKFHLAESFGLAGDTDRALDLLELAVDQGFYPYPFMAEHCLFLAPIRPLPRFADILARAQGRAEAFRKSENERVSSLTSAV